MNGEVEQKDGLSFKKKKGIPLKEDRLGLELNEEKGCTCRVDSI